MRHFKQTKVYIGAVITAIDNDMVATDDGDEIRVGHHWLTAMTPKVGDLLVQAGGSWEILDGDCEDCDPPEPEPEPEPTGTFHAADGDGHYLAFDENGECFMCDDEAQAMVFESRDLALACITDAGDDFSAFAPVDILR